jgi:hypothetical protein
MIDTVSKKDQYSTEQTTIPESIKAGELRKLSVGDQIIA